MKKQQGWLTTKELATLLGISKQSVLAQIKRGKYSQMKEIKGKRGGSRGKVWMVNITDPAIPLDKQNQFLNIQGVEHPSIINGAGVKGSSFLPQQTKRKECQPLPPAPVKKEKKISPKSKTVAIARFNLLKLWDRHIENAKSQKIKVNKATEDFLFGYNSQLIYKETFKVLGTTSKSTLYIWKRELGGTDDWKNLVPNYRNSNEYPGLTKEESETFRNLYLSPNQLTVSDSAKYTKLLLTNDGIESPSGLSKFRRYAEVMNKKEYHLVSLNRYGQKHLRDNVIPHVKRNPSLLEVGDMLVADGHRLNFEVINPFTGKPGRALLVGYFDWKSYSLCGYEIMMEENTQCIASALRNAIINLGKMPKYAYQDNGKAFRAKYFTSSKPFTENDFNGVFARLGIKPIFAKPYNARAKIIEGWFKTFSNQFERLVPSFRGSSIENKPAYLMRNEKYHKANHDYYVPTIDQVIQCLDTFLAYLSKNSPCPYVKGKTIGQVFLEGKGDGVDVELLDDMMLAETRKRIGPNGIRFLHHDYFNENLYGLREKVIIRYNLRDLSYLKAYLEDGTNLGKIERIEAVHPIAFHEGSPRDVTTLQNTLALQKRLEKETIQEAREMKAKGIEGKLNLGNLLNIPKFMDKLDKENLLDTFESDERSIPEELIADPITTDIKKSQEEPEEEIWFESEWDKYLWIRDNGPRDEEDQAFFDEFKQSKKYQDTFGGDIDLVSVAQ